MFAFFGDNPNHPKQISDSCSPAIFLRPRSRMSSASTTIAEIDTRFNCKPTPGQLIVHSGVAWRSSTVWPTSGVTTQGRFDEILTWLSFVFPHDNAVFGCAGIGRVGHQFQIRLHVKDGDVVTGPASDFPGQHG